MSSAIREWTGRSPHLSSRGTMIAIMVDTIRAGSRRNAPTVGDALILKQGIRQLEAMTFVRMGIEFCRDARTEAPDLRGIVDAEARPFVEGTSMPEDVPAPGFVDMEANHLSADRTWRSQRMKPPAAKELEELNDPYGKVPHVRLLPR
jgi:hypothetical protein